MDKNQIENLFLGSIKNKVLDKFLLGEGLYFVADREYGNHWCYGSYRDYIEPYIDKCFPESFWDEVNILLLNYHDKNILLDALVAYLIPYYNCSNVELLNARIRNTSKQTLFLIKALLIENRENLKLDNRGTGVQWNSKEGLFGSITQNLQIIKERGGPNFLSDELC